MATKKRKPPYAEIKIASGKKAGKPFKKISLSLNLGSAGILTPDKPVKSIASAKKTIVSVMDLAHGTSILVVESDKVKGETEYTLCVDGSTEVSDKPGRPAIADTDEGVSVAVDDDEDPDDDYDQDNDDPDDD